MKEQTKLTEMFMKKMTGEDVGKIFAEAKPKNKKEFMSQLFGQALDEVLKKEPQVMKDFFDAMHENEDVSEKTFIGTYHLINNLPATTFDSFWLGLDSFKRMVWTVAGLDPFVKKDVINAYFEQLPAELFEDVKTLALKCPAEFAATLEFIGKLAEVAEEYRLTDDDVAEEIVLKAN